MSFIGTEIGTSGINLVTGIHKPNGARRWYEYTILTRAMYVVCVLEIKRIFYILRKEFLAYHDLALRAILLALTSTIKDFIISVYYRVSTVRLKN